MKWYFVFASLCNSGGEIDFCCWSTIHLCFSREIVLVTDFVSMALLFGRNSFHVVAMKRLMRFMVAVINEAQKQIWIGLGH